MVLTCPGPIKPSNLKSGLSRIALMAGIIMTWLQKMEKLVVASALARSKVIAVDGVVVSKPMAKKTVAAGAVAAEVVAVWTHPRCFGTARKLPCKITAWASTTGKLFPACSRMSLRGIQN